MSLHLHAGQRQQLVPDAQPGGPDDGEVVVLQQLVHRPDGAVGAVLNGQHTEPAQAGLHSGHHSLEGLHIHDVAPGAAAGHRPPGSWPPPRPDRPPGPSGERPRYRPPERRADLGGHLGGGGDQLCLPGPGQLEQGGEQVVGIPLPLPGFLRHLGQDGPLPFFVQNGQMVRILVGSHLVGQVHALQEQVQQLLVHCVDLLSNLRKFHDVPPIINLTARRQ